jgi:hypothetical protein
VSCVVRLGLLLLVLLCCSCANNLVDPCSSNSARGLSSHVCWLGFDCDSSVPSTPPPSRHNGRLKSDIVLTRAHGKACLGVQVGYCAEAVGDHHLIVLMLNQMAAGQQQQQQRVLSVEELVHKSTGGGGVTIQYNTLWRNLPWEPQGSTSLRAASAHTPVSYPSYPLGD